MTMKRNRRLGQCAVSCCLYSVESRPEDDGFDQEQWANSGWERGRPKLEDGNDVLRLT